MSAFVATFSANDKRLDDQLGARMLNVIRTHGPDDQAYWRDDAVFLGHASLVTTREQSLEAQPSSIDGKVWIAADVRLDARAELIGELRRLGHHVLFDCSDDMLVLHAYDAWGVDCLDHLAGDFSFALWDTTQRRLLCATDHMGVSPLYHAPTGDGLVVSTALNAVRVHPDVSGELNEQAIADYLLSRMNHSADSTTLRSISKLPAGHRLVANASGVTIDCYWQVPEPSYERTSKREYVEQFAELFDRAVSDRLRADHAGSHLSGGMDSTAITATLARLRDAGEAQRIDAYTYTPQFGELSIELSFATRVAERSDVPLHVFKSEGTLPAQIDDLAELPPEPSFASRSINRLLLLGHSAGHCPTFFAGFGGDPLLHPLPSYWSGLRSDRQFGAYATDVARCLAEFKRPPRSALARTIAPVRKRRDLPSWLNADFARRNHLAEQQKSAKPRDYIDPDMRAGMQTSPLWRRIFEWHSPAYSLLPQKVRFPFFDIRLVGFMQTVPPYPWMLRKHLLRVAMQDRLPANVLERPKTAFPRDPMQVAADKGALPDYMTTAPASGLIDEFVDVERFGATLTKPRELDSRSITRVRTLDLWLENQNAAATDWSTADIDLSAFTAR